MSSIEGIPSYVLQNMSMVQENIKSIMADNLGIGGSKVDFDGFLSSAIGDMSSTFNDSDFGDGIMYEGNSYGKAMPGMSGNSAKAQDINRMIKQQNLNSHLPDTEATASINKAYNSLLNGDMAKQLAPEIASIDNKSINELKKIKSNNTSVVDDNDFFNANSLTPFQITDILKKKGSPYAYKTYEGNKSIGQLIYDECHKAGSIDKGNHQINPSLVISIMGAESTFGTDPKAYQNNPFNIRVNGSFSNVNKFEQSLNMAVNTMYNWAQDRPKDSKVSFLDYAGDKYCENYKQEWKPNVEKYFLEFNTHTDSMPALANKINDNDQNQKLMNQVLSSLNTGTPSSPGMNIADLMKMVNNKNNPQTVNALKNMNMLSAMDTSSIMGENKEE
ncbi:MAG: hypothetical protein H7263_10850 [Candidatus Sericytochromatia bacterium]|nr:hypothetical protein [Candidatus Sericytochromatia bacterium]